MSDRYAFHPQELATDETEQFYKRMSEKGWQLVKRGAFLSRFQRAELMNVRYRIVVVMPAASSSIPFSEEQMAEYERSGWEYVTGQGFIHVFRVNEQEAATEVYLSREQQTETLKTLKKRYRNSLIQLPLSIAFFLLMGFILGSSGGLRSFMASAYLGWVENTAGVAGLLFLLLWFIVRDLGDIWYLKRLCNKMNDELPAGHSGHSGHFWHSQSGGLYLQLLSQSLLLLALSFGLLAAGQRVGGYNRDMPQEPDGPYLVLSDLGVEGERCQSFIKNRTSRVIFEQSLLSSHWDTYEVVDVSGEEVWIQQKVYRVKNADRVAGLVESLMKDSAFHGSIEDFTAVEIEGLNQAWVSERLECIAVKGNLVSFITYPDYGRGELRVVLQAVANRWMGGDN